MHWLERLLGFRLWSVSIMASQFKITWAAPTARTDGTALPLTEIDHYDLYANGTLLASVLGSAVMTTVSMTLGQQHCFTMKTVDVDARESALSNEECSTLPSDAPPDSPVITVTVIP